MKAATATVEKSAAMTATVKAQIAAASAQTTVEQERAHVEHRLEVVRLQGLVDAAARIDEERELMNQKREAEKLRVEEKREAEKLRVEEQMQRVEEHRISMQAAFTKTLLEQTALTIRSYRESATVKTEMERDHAHSMLHGVAIATSQSKLSELVPSHPHLRTHTFAPTPSHPTTPHSRRMFFVLCHFCESSDIVSAQT